MELKASPIKRYLRRLAAQFRLDLVEARLGKLQCLGIAIESDQLSPRTQAPDNLFRVPRKPERAVCNDASCAYIEKINRFL